MNARRIPPLARLGLFLGASLALSLASGTALYAAAGVLVGLALVLGLSRGMVRALAWIALAPMPAYLVLFTIAGREAVGSWGPGLVWGLVRLAPYTLRVASLMLANLLLLRVMPLPELIGALRGLPIPDQAALFLATLLRFLPTTLQEARRVVEAQRCRGMERRRLLTPAGFLSLAIPLFLAQIQKSHDLALSLEIRCGTPDRS
jgi:energy-coupling factor transport system permease protein